MSEQINDNLLGVVFAGHYSVEKLLSRSATSAVYEAVDKRNSASVALKLIGSLDGDQPARERFVREAQIVRSLVHPNICALLDYGFTAEAVPFCVMEFVKGRSLAQTLHELGPLSPPDAISMLIATCRAVQYLHSRGIVHRDLRPSNLLVLVFNEQMTVKVIDFGITKGAGDGVHQLTGATGSKETLFSLSYTAPERLAGRQADARSDIYALGCVLYEALTGINPFGAGTADKFSQSQLRSMPEPLAKSGVEARAAILLQPIIAKALDVNPLRRFESVAELKDVLERIATPVKLACAGSSVGSRSGNQAARRRKPHVAALVSVCLLLAVIAALITAPLLEQLQDANLLRYLGW